MNGKRYACVLLIFIFCLISASAVCAAENSTDDIIGSDVNDDISKTGIAKDASIANENEECDLEKNDDDFSLSLSDNMSDDAVGVSTYTFKDLYNKIKDGGETTLQFNYAYNYDTDKDIIDSASGGIRLTKDLILHGNGRTIDAKNSVIHFVVYKCSLTIDNLKLVNGKETKSGTGGAIYVYSNNGDNARLNATKCIFNNNHAQNGGAILVTDKSRLTLTRCTFTGNEATDLGGAIAISGSVQLFGREIQNCNFTNNRAKNGGGAILVQQGINDLLTFWDLYIRNSYFKNNSAINSDGAGGAVYGSDSAISIENSVFSSNSAKDTGGAITALDCNRIKILSSNFTSNCVTGPLSCGGALYVQDIDALQISESNFTDNHASISGGAIHGSAKISGLFPWIVSLSNFKNNSANAAGAMTIIDCHLAHISGSDFTGNNATGSNSEGGGAILTLSSDLVIDSSNFTDNHVKSIFGGAIRSLHSKGLLVEDAKFINNTVTGNGGFGGAILVSSDEGNSIPVVISKSDFLNNKATYGGAIFISTVYNVTVVDSNFINNSASYGGSIYFIDSDCVNINGSNFTNNIGNKDGGAIYAKSSNLVIKSIFDKNLAGMGGAIYAIDSYLNVSSTFMANQGGFGGAIYTKNNATISSIFINNSAFFKGGAVYGSANATDSSLTLDSSQFYNNYAQDNEGGAVYVQYMNLFVGNSYFNNNTANRGGSIFIVGKGRSYRLTVDGSQFYNNSARDLGGAIEGEFIDSFIKDSLFENNSAGFRGGAISSLADDNYVLTVEDSQFYTNNAINNGGAVFVQQGNLSVDNSYFDNNTADYRGGAIFLWNNIDNSASANIGNSQFYNNNALDYGGAIFATYYILSINDSDFENSNASEGGGIYAYCIPSLTITNSTLSKSSAYAGSAIVASDVPVFAVVDSEFFDNVESTDGAILLKGITNLNVLRSNFTNNVAIDEVGGAISLFDNSTLKVSNSIFKNNLAMMRSGAIHSHDCLININDNSLFYNNTAIKDDVGIYAREGYLSNSTFINTKFAGHFYAYQCTFINEVLFKIDYIYTVTYGTSFNVTVRDACNFNGVVNVTIGDNSYEVKLVRGVGSVTITDLPIGEYKATIYFMNSEYVPYPYYCESNVFNVKPQSYIDLAELISKAETGSVITLDRDYEFDPYYDSSLIGGIVIDKNITINGNNHVLDMKNAARMFNVTGKANLTVENLNFINAKADDAKDEGSAIHVESGILNVCNSNFTNSSGKLGAVYISKDSTANIINSTFTDNHAVEGGAIWIGGDDAYVSECVFVANTASQGGAIWVGGDNAYVGECVFVANTASEGGAVYSEVDGTRVDTCHFNTSSDTFNAHVTVLQPTLTINDFALVYNFGDNITFSLKTRSGRILTNMVISIEVFDENGTSYQNNSILSGGRWTVELPVGYYTVNCSAADFADANVNVALYIFEKGIGSFRDLNRVINGGNDLVIDLTEDYVFHSLLDDAFKEGIVINRPVTINGNGHRIDGAHQARIFHVNADDVTINDVVFVNGNASYGGALYWAGGDDGEVCNCQFVNNTASEGGAIYSEVNGTCADSCYFNTGSDTYNDYVDTFLPNLTADNFTIPYNSGYKLPVFVTAHCGRIITDRIISMNVFYENNTFYQSYSFLSGDSWMVDLPVGSYYAVISTDSVASSPVQVAIAVLPNTFIGLDNLVNGHDYSEIYLNGDYVFDSSVDNGFTEGITISKPVTIYGNGHIIDGKGEVRLFDVKADNVTFINLTFINGFANVYSGAVKGKSLAINCSFINNTGDYGGAMFEGAAINSVFINNSARYGGAIQSLVVTNCTFIGNHANTGAGVGYAMMGYASSVAYNCTFINNYAPDTGGMQGDAYNCTFIGNHADDGTVGALCGNAYNCTFIENYARGDGYKGSYGAMSGNAYNCTFIRNNAIHDGGAMGGYAYNCTFIENYAGRNGGAMHYGHAYNCTFIGNHADKDGGAIWDSWGSPGHCAEDCYFIGNYARDGGAVLAGIVNSSTFINNSARRMGGATYLTITNNCTFSGNTQPVVLSFKDLNETINSNNDSDIYLEYYFVYNGEIDSDFTDGIEINRDVVIHGNGHVLDGNEVARIFKVADGVKAIFKDIVFESASAYEGGTSINGSDCTAINCTFLNNNVIVGGAMYGGLAINCTFSSNSGFTAGAAMHGGCAINCTFINNQAFVGSGLYDGTAINCTFIDNVGLVIKDSTADSCIFINGIITENTVILQPVLHISNLTVAYGAGENLTFYLTTNSGMPLDNVNVTMNVFYINGTFYKSYSFLSGEKWNIDLLGSYFAVCDIDVYDMDPVKVTIDVKIPTVISADEVITPYKVNRNLVIALKSDNGTPIGGMNVTVSGLDGVKVYRTDANGEIQIPTRDLAPKTYDVEISFRETDIHYASSNATRVYIQKIIPVLQVSNLTVAYTAGGNLTFSLTNRSGMPLDYVNITMDVFYRNGTFYNNYSFLNGDVWNVDLPIGSYYGICDIDIYDMDPVKVTIEIKIPTAVVSSGEIITPYKVNRNLVIVLKDDNATPISGMNVTVSGLNGVKVYSTDANGEIQIPTVDLAPKAYDVQVSFMGSDIYFASSTATKIYIQEPTQIKSAPLTTVYNSYKYLVTPILDSKGKPLKNEAINITINGVTYSCKSNNDGNAMLTIRLKPKTYTATVAFAGNEKYTPATQVVKVIVKKATPKITAKKKTFKRKVKTKKYTVVLKDNNKNPMAKVKLTLKIKKKTYKAKTNKKGKATFKIKKLTKKGKYKAVIKYKGNGCYKAVSKKVQIKLK